MSSTPPPGRAPRNQTGFTLLELMVAMVVTLVITGAMYGLVVSGQGAFRREPALTDRQQQIRIAMARIQDDVLRAGIGLGPLIQSFAENANGIGMLGVRALGDANLGGGNSDHIEIRQKTLDCPSVRVDPNNPRNGANYNAIDGWPACYPEPGWVLAFFPDGNAKWGWGHNQHGGANAKFNFPPGQQPGNSQMIGVQNLSCSLDLAVLGGAGCPAGNQGEAIYFEQMDRIYYRLGYATVADQAANLPSLFRSTNGGIDVATEAPANPGALDVLTSATWQLIAVGIEDLQVRYRSFGGWQDSAPTISPVAAAPYDNVIREVEITLWARTQGANQIQGQTRAVGNGITAVRASMTTSVAPRAAQESLRNEPNPAKRWQ